MWASWRAWNQPFLAASSAAGLTSQTVNHWRQTQIKPLSPGQDSMIDVSTRRRGGRHNADNAGQIRLLVCQTPLSASKSWRRVLRSLQASAGGSSDWPVYDVRDADAQSNRFPSDPCAIAGDAGGGRTEWLPVWGRSCCPEGVTLHQVTAGRLRSRQVITGHRGHRQTWPALGDSVSALS